MAKFFVECLKTMTKEKVVCYIETMFIQVKQGTKHPEAGP